jgi:HlyD family secretion protein
VAADQFSSSHEEAQAALRSKEAELRLILAPPRPQEVAEQQARIREESSLVVQRRQDFERAQSMYERKLTPKSALEQAEAALNAEEARLATAQQRLQVLKAPPKPEAVEQLKADIARLSRQVEFYAGQLKATVFTAPVSGRVVWLSTQDREVCRIVRTDSLRCELDVEEAYAPLIQGGQDVTLKLPSSPFDTYSGKLVRVARVGQRTSHSSTFAAVAAFANPGGLDPGMTGYAKVTTGNRTFAWRVVRRIVRFLRIEFWSWW